MKYRIVADSSSNVKSVSTVEFASAPLKITVDQTTFVDDSSLDLPALVHALRTVKGASRTACPSPDEWIAAFGLAFSVIWLFLKVLDLILKLTGKDSSDN